MKALAITEDKDYRFFSLLKPIEAAGFQLGVTESIDPEAFNQFRPDVVIHNTNKIIPFAGPKIKIDFNTIDPFVDITNEKPVVKDKFKADFSFIGDINDLNSDLVKEIFKYKTRVFNTHPNGTVLYAGRASLSDVHCIYASSKGVLLSEKDKFNGYRYVDIIYSGSIPVSSVSDLEDALSRKKQLDRSSVLKSTNFDRAAEVLKKNGLEKISKIILDKKRLFV